MSWEAIIALIVGIPTVLATICGGLYCAGRLLYQAAWGVSEMVGQTKQANAHAAEANSHARELKDEMVGVKDEVKGMRQDFGHLGERVGTLEWWARRQDHTFGQEG